MLRLRKYSADHSISWEVDCGRTKQRLLGNERLGKKRCSKEQEMRATEGEDKVIPPEAGAIPKWNGVG